MNVLLFLFLNKQVNLNRGQQTGAFSMGPQADRRYEFTEHSRLLRFCRIRADRHTMLYHVICPVVVLPKSLAPYQPSKIHTAVAKNTFSKINVLEW